MKQKYILFAVVLLIVAGAFYYVRQKKSASPPESSAGTNAPNYYSGKNNDWPDDSLQKSALRNLGLELAEANAYTYSAVTLPPKFTGADSSEIMLYGIFQGVCQKGGYSMEPYANQKVDVFSYHLKELYDKTEPLDATVWSSGNKIICIIKLLHQGSKVKDTLGMFPPNFHK